MKTILVRYKVKPELADDNQRLIEQTFAELARDKPDGLRYQTFRLDDGVSFMHVATRDGGAEESPLMKVEAFRAFLAGIKDRCVEPPVQTEVKAIGRYDGL
ncbi:hypothetical protein [Polaromonas sp. A23]|uniref:hypothetical protein n=1 Tax=Polaromonas sp. A23 TaxID=1944133 RepID=UPI000985FF62|nr:hypothetical protein [Polaromonas sp. A23]OOG39814.1 hypothetical protein B0B52_14405 [Polaromonas sp. A23]